MKPDELRAHIAAIAPTEVADAMRQHPEHFDACLTGACKAMEQGRRTQRDNSR
jgi:hypothetical protein